MFFADTFLWVVLWSDCRWGCVNEIDVRVSCVWCSRLLYSKGWRRNICICTNQIKVSVHISAKAIAEKAVAASITISCHRHCSTPRLGEERVCWEKLDLPISVPSLLLSGVTWWFFNVQPCLLNLARFFCRVFTYPCEPNIIRWSIFSGFEQM